MDAAHYGAAAGVRRRPNSVLEHFDQLAGVMREEDLSEERQLAAGRAWPKSKAVTPNRCANISTRRLRSAMACANSNRAVNSTPESAK